MVRRNTRSLAIKMLHALNYYYSLRDLEELLEIPFQVLWKYVNLINIPEEKTAKKILLAIEKRNLIRSALEDLMEKKKHELNTLYRDICFLRLASLILEEFVLKENIDCIIPLSIHALTLASIISTEMHIRLCPVFCHSTIYENEGFYIHYYTRGKANEVDVIMIPRKCLQGVMSPLLLDYTIGEMDMLKTVIGVLRRIKIKKVTMYFIYLSEEQINTIKELGVENVYFLELFKKGFNP